MIQRIPCGRIISLAFPSLFGQGEKDEPHLSQRPGGVETHRLDPVEDGGRSVTEARITVDFSINLAFVLDLPIPLRFILDLQPLTRFI